MATLSLWSCAVAVGGLLHASPCRPCGSCPLALRHSLPRAEVAESRAGGDARPRHELQGCTTCNLQGGPFTIIILSSHSFAAVLGHRAQQRLPLLDILLPCHRAVRTTWDSSAANIGAPAMSSGWLVEGETVAPAAHSTELLEEGRATATRTCGPWQTRALKRFKVVRARRREDEVYQHQAKWGEFSRCSERMFSGFGLKG